MSNHTVPDSEAASCTGAASRQALCSGTLPHSGNALTSPARAARSAALGRRTSSSPPPSTITALFTGEAAAASAPTVVTAVITSALVAPTPITVLLLQLKRAAPAAPVHTQPLPVGVAASVSPVGSWSVTV